jgi:nicotinamide mononucleotide adenylyltransferase
MSGNPLLNAQGDTYSFPAHRLARKLRDESRTPVVLVACGSFSPVTYLHLRMFEMARDYIKQQTRFEIIGGYLSPVNDQYKKPGLLSAGMTLPLHVPASPDALLKPTG